MEIMASSENMLETVRESLILLMYMAQNKLFRIIKLSTLQIIPGAKSLATVNSGNASIDRKIIGGATKVFVVV